VICKHVLKIQHVLKVEDIDMVDYENLMKSMDASAEEKIAELMVNTGKTTAEIRERAAAKAEEIKKLHMDSALKAVVLVRNKQSYIANKEVGNQAACLKHELFNEAFTKARERLLSFRDSAQYADSFRKMAEEAVQALGENDIVLHVDKKDEALSRKIAETLDKRCEVVADNDCLGGLNVSTPDGKVFIYNTVESRLESARRRMRLEIFNTLYGDRR